MQSKILLVLAVIITFCVTINFALDKENSLLSAIDKAKGKDRIDAISDLVFFYSISKPLEGKSWAENGIKEAEKLNYAEGKVKLLNGLGRIFMALHETNKTIETLERVNPLLKLVSDKKLISETYNYLGLAYMIAGRFTVAADYHINALNLSRENKDKKNLATAYNYLGILSYIQKKYEKALDYCQQALVITISIDDKEGTSLAYEHLGYVYAVKNDYKKAIDYNYKALELRNELGDAVEASAIYHNLGIFYGSTGELQKSLHAIEEAITLREKYGDRKGVGSLYSDLGATYILQNQNEVGMKYYFESLKIRKEINDLRGTVAVLKKIIYEYEVNKDFKNALKYYKELYMASDSLNNLNRHDFEKELQLKIETAGKQKQLDLLNENYNLEKTQQTYLVFVIILISILLVVGLISYLIKRNAHRNVIKKNNLITEQKEKLEKLNNELIQLNTEKDKVFSIIAHDLRTPFTALMGFSEVIKTELDNLSKEELKKFIDSIYLSSRNLYNLLENLLQWSRVNRGVYELSLEQFEINEVLESVIHVLNENAKLKRISIINEVQNNQLIFSDRLVINLVLRNIISNAIKFSNQGGRVKIMSGTSDGFVEISISDTGVGIPELQLNRLFTNEVVSTNGTDNESGTGLGLILCKEMIEKSGGHIWVNSQVGKGSTFTFSQLINPKQI
ncbi:MAG: hypothetical protein C4539_19815 [Ignavibacteriales bacterium]|nr:MAG: hypothetical protein C4539_19815 [Ignavibacteriales bacterium]